MQRDILLNKLYARCHFIIILVACCLVLNDYVASRTMLPRCSGLGCQQVTKNPSSPHNHHVRTARHHGMPLQKYVDRPGRRLVTPWIMPKSGGVRQGKSQVPPNSVIEKNHLFSQ